MEPKAEREKVFAHMKATRPGKYGAFLLALKSFRYLAASPTKGELLESVYALMRRVDDIVDGDLELPQGYATRAEFADDRIRFAKTKVNPNDTADHLLAYSFTLADELGLEIEQEVLDIYHSMRFDATRAGTHNVFPKATLDEHFDLLDIRGTISGSVKVFGGTASQYQSIEQLGIASRIFYNLRDYDEDMQAGLINVPLEDVARNGITDLKNRDSAAVQKWFQEQAHRGLACIEEYRARITGEDIIPLIRTTLLLVYEKPAQWHFEKVLRAT